MSIRAEEDLVERTESGTEEDKEGQPFPTIYYVHKSNPGPGTSTIVNQGEGTRNYTAWNQISYHPPVKEFKVNQYKELVQDQPLPASRDHRELELEEETTRHNLASSGINEGLPLEIPEGLEELNAANTVLIKRAHQGTSRYIVVNKMADRAFWWIDEDTSVVGRLVQGQLRSFTMVFRDVNNDKVARMTRPFRFGCSCCTMCSCCFFCQRQKIEVEAPIGSFIGGVREEKTWSLCENLNVYNVDDRAILRVVGPSGGFTNFGMTFYPIYSLLRKNMEIGRIIRQPAGTTSQAGFNYTIQYPLNIRPELKLVIMSSAVLIDFMYYQKDNSESVQY